MKTLERNKKQFYYALNLGKTEIIDEQGRHTAEYKTSYSVWKPYKANISPARGESTADFFGNDVQYDRIIVTDDVTCEIDENTVLAIDIAPNTRTTADVSPVFDYVVTRKAVSLNFVSYAVAKVKTNV